jgi:hypothetical protein
MSLPPSPTMSFKPHSNRLGEAETQSRNIRAQPVLPRGTRAGPQNCQASSPFAWMQASLRVQRRKSLSISCFHKKHFADWARCAPEGRIDKSSTI